MGAESLDLRWYFVKIAPFYICLFLLPYFFFAKCGGGGGGAQQVHEELAM